MTAFCKLPGLLLSGQLSVVKEGLPAPVHDKLMLALVFALLRSTVPFRTVNTALATGAIVQGPI